MKTINNFKQIVLDEVPLIDVRAPIEYHKGAFNNTVNLPLMNDRERHLIGKQYKKEGNEAATKLGYKLVSGDIKEARVQAWVDYINTHPNSNLYCFRGGQRSKISQHWIKEAMSHEIPRIEGGYKAFRNYLIKHLNDLSYLSSKPILLGGYTGSGKTLLLDLLHHKIDLEGIAHHRGSSFGRHVTPQPTQINFENSLAYALIQFEEHGFNHLVVEDEGRHIGRCYLPKPLSRFFDQGEIVLLDVPFEERVQITLNEYVTESQKNYQQYYGLEEGLKEWTHYIKDSLKKIYKRLGDQRYQQIMNDFDSAYQTQLQTGNQLDHEKWIEPLLKEYYDPMYQYQIDHSNKDILFQGNTEEVYQFLNQLK